MSTIPIPDERPYREALDYLYGRINYERAPDAAGSLQDFKLVRMERLLRLIGDPQEQVPTVHITGTKGKGSTATMTARIAEAAGYRVGLFTSPHMRRFEERMTVNGRLPSPATVVTLVNRIRPIVEQLDREGLPPTFFELATAMGWLHFLDERVDLAVVEVGLGGRLDSTNVCRPSATAITSISRDHTRLLGDTPEAIAGEKAGIAKRGVPLVSGVVDPGPTAVIREIAERIGAPVVQIDRDFTVRVRPCDGAAVSLPVSQSFDLRAFDREILDLRSAMPGLHQTRNAAISACLAFLLRDRFPRLNDDAIRKGLAAAFCPLRVEAVRTGPLVILDAAHNPASIEALVETLRPVAAARRIAVFASSRDKETRTNLTLLGRAFDEVILTNYLTNPRAMGRAELTGLARESLSIPWRWVETPEAAWHAARNAASQKDLICFTGSFFLAAEVEDLLTADRPDRTRDMPID